jgi:hypothetical protein
LFIPDPYADFYPSRIPDPGVKQAPDPGSGSATLLLSVRKVEEASLCDQKGGKALPKTEKSMDNRNAMILTFLDKTEPPRSGMDAQWNSKTHL